MSYRRFGVVWCRLLAAVVVVGLWPSDVWAIDSEQLKPCFERYDGHKLFGAAPIHSEWRMKSEEDCLPFCIRAASRCASIVYDKQEHTCYYFSVNGIEMENIERNTGMVYLQVAERRCVDDMLMVMESEDAQEQQVTISFSPEISNKDRHYILQRYPEAVESQKQPKMEYGKIEVEMSVSGEPATAETLLDTTLITTTPSIATPAIQRNVEELHITAEQVIEDTFRADETATSASGNVDKIYEDSEMLYGITPSEKIDSLVKPLETVVHAAANANILPTVVLERYNTSKLNKYKWKSNDYLDANVQNAIKEQPLPDSTKTTLSVMDMPKIPNLPLDPIASINTVMDSMPSLLPVMNGFKAQRRPIPVDTAVTEKPTSVELNEEQLNFHISNDVRRHPVGIIETTQKSLPEIPTTVVPTIHRSKTASPVSLLRLDEENLSRDDTPDSAYVNGNDGVPFDEFAPELDGKRIAASIPHVESLPPSSMEAGEIITEDGMPYTDHEGDQNDYYGCDVSMRNEIWLAVESAKLKSSLRTRNMNYLAARQPKDCMRDCNLGKINGKRKRCDSFTYLENSRQCVFDAVLNSFMQKMVAPAPRADFSTRVFYRLCYPTNMTRFRSCAEFLAFRNYALNIPAREFFNGLPNGTEGITACVELCVLSDDFQCRSALFDGNTGVCQLFDEHSLSAPLAFKEHSRTNQLYFENGCIDGGELPQVESLGSTLHRS